LRTTLAGTPATIVHEEISFQIKLPPIIAIEEANIMNDGVLPHLYPGQLEIPSP
jgi:hypothetical protein